MRKRVDRVRRFRPKTPHTGEPQLIESMRAHGPGWVKFQPSRREKSGASFWAHTDDFLEVFDEFVSKLVADTRQATLSDAVAVIDGQLTNAESWTDPGASDYRAALHFALDTLRPAAVPERAP